jgi:hypothetical protein
MPAIVASLSHTHTSPQQPPSLHLWRYEDQRRGEGGAAAQRLEIGGAKYLALARSDRVVRLFVRVRLAPDLCVSRPNRRGELASLGGAAGVPPCRPRASAASAPPTRRRLQSSGTSRADLPRPPLAAAAPPPAARARRRARRRRRGNRPSGLRPTTPSPCSAIRFVLPLLEHAP